MSSTLIGWIVTIAFVVILIVGFFVGFWRGLKKSTVNVVISFVGVVAAFFVTPLITNAILGFSITLNGSPVPLRELALELLSQDPDVALLIASSPSLKTFVLALPGAVSNTLVFMIVTLAVEGVLYIVYKILAGTAFRYKIGQKKHRTWGGVVGLIKTFILVLFAMMPFASLTGLASSMVQPTVVDNNQASAAEKEITQSESLLASKLSHQVEEIIIGLDNNILMKCCGVFGLDNAMFDYYAKVDIDGQEVIIRSEVSNIYQTADAVYQISQVIENSTGISHLNYDVLSNLLDKIVDGGLFKGVVSPTLGNIITNEDSQSIILQLPFVEGNEEVVTKISDDLKAEKTASGSYHNYFANDIKNMFKVFRNMGESGFIDGMLTLNFEDTTDVLEYFTNEDNVETFALSLKKLFDVKIVRAAIKPVVEMGLGFIMQGGVPVDVNTTGWSEQQWQECSQNLSDTISLFADVATQASITEILANPTILLDTTKNYNIETLTSNIGKLIDTIRANQLLQTAEGKSIIDSMLEDGKITLPADEVKVLNENGSVDTKTIENYQQLFEFIAPSIKLMRDEGIFEILSKTNAVELLAEKISQQGKDKLLLDIILPLNQVEFTSEVVESSLISGLDKEFIDFTLINGYDEWKKDLEYISQMLIALQTRQTTVLEGSPEVEQTYTLLQLVLNGRLDKVIDSIDLTKEGEVEVIFKPLLYAKSTANMKVSVLEAINSMVADIADTTVSIPSAFTFKQGDGEDQTDEFISICNLLITINQTSDTEDISSINRTLLGSTLEAMKYNAYRTSLMDKMQEGVFANAFTALMGKFKQEYQFEIEVALPLLAAQGDSEAEQYYDQLTNNKYSEINFIEMMNYLTEKEELINSLPRN